MADAFVTRAASRQRGADASASWFKVWKATQDIQSLSNNALQMCSEFVAKSNELNLNQNTNPLFEPNTHALAFSFDFSMIGKYCSAKNHDGTPCNFKVNSTGNFGMCKTHFKRFGPPSKWSSNKPDVASIREAVEILSNTFGGSRGSLTAGMSLTLPNHNKQINTEACDICDDDEYEDIPQELTCNVCLTKRKDRVFAPCSHLATCDDCTDRIMSSSTPKCPICNTHARFAMKIYNS